MGYSSDWLGGEDTDAVRTSQEIARRALALGAAVAISFEAGRGQVGAWLEATRICEDLTEPERNFVYSSATQQQAKVNFTWKSEALTVLLWAIGKLPVLPAPDKQCSTGALGDILPPFGEESAEEFLGSACARSDQELLETAFRVQQLHALARQRKGRADYRPDEPAVDIEIIQERHHAINWVVGYCGLEWEDVTTDT